MRRNEDRHPLRVLAEVDRRLPRGVRAADDDDVLVAAGAGLGHRRAVVDAGAGQLREPGGVELAVGHAGGHEHAVRAQLAAAAERDDAPGALDAQRLGVADGEQLGAEPARLVGRAPGEVGPGEPGREAEVVLDAAGLARLSAGRLALDEHRLEPLRRAVDGGRQAGGPAADDDEVVVVGGRRAGRRRGARPARGSSGARRRSRPRAARPAGGRRRRSRRSAARAPRRRARRRGTAPGRGCARGSRAGRGTPSRSGGRSRGRRRS